MNLHDYTDPTDPYAPRTKASQEVAAAKRARPTDDGPTPTHILPARTRQYLPFGIGALVIIALMIGMATYQLARKPVALAITPQPTQTMDRTSVRVSAPPVQPTATLARMITAYAAPDGVRLGQIDADRAIVPVAHYGSGWVAYQDGAGLVWVRARDVPHVALAGPDLAPAAAQPAQTGQGMTISQGGSYAPPAPQAAPDKGTKLAPDRATRYATAVARDAQTHGSK